MSQPRGRVVGGSLLSEAPSLATGILANSVLLFAVWKRFVGLLIRIVVLLLQRLVPFRYVNAVASDGRRRGNIAPVGCRVRRRVRRKVVVWAERLSFARLNFARVARAGIRL